MRVTSRLFDSTLSGKRVLAIAKQTEWDFFKSRHESLSDDKLITLLKAYGQDTDNMLYEHRVQLECEKEFERVLRTRKIDVRVTKTINAASMYARWANLIVAIGGDGTFLLAAKLLRNNVKPILGINPNCRFPGALTLSRESSSNIANIFDKLERGQFKYIMRSRIRTTMEGEGLYGEPFNVHEKRRSRGEKRVDALQRTHEGKIADALQPRYRTLPWLALNEVYLSEFFAARGITLRVFVDDRPECTVRCSGICVCTGSGSHSWFRSMNLHTPTTIQTLAQITGCKLLNEAEAHNLWLKYHETLTFDPADSRMTYKIRELHRVARVKYRMCPPECQMCKKIKVVSNGFDAGIVLDGCISLPFNDGTVATFEIRPEDALRSIVLM